VLSTAHNGEYLASRVRHVNALSICEVRGYCGADAVVLVLMLSEISGVLRSTAGDKPAG